MINARGDYEWPDPAPEREWVSLVVDNDDPDCVEVSGGWLADTDPQDGGSFFSVGGISVSPPSPAGAGRVVSLSWPSVEGRTYTVLRAERPGEEFVPYVVGVPATPPENVLPLPADDSDSAFYRVSIDVP